MYLKHQRELNASDDEGKKKREHVLTKLSDTRWACRADSITANYHTLEAVIATLKEIRKNEKKTHIAAKAKGLFQNICDFEFVLVWRYYFDDIYETYRDLYFIHLYF